MDKFYEVLTWVGLFLYWLMVASVTMRVVLRRRAMGVSLAWLLIIFILPIAGVVLYLLFGELNLGKKRAQRAKSMFKPYADWMQDLSDCPGYLPHRMGFHARPVHELCVKRTSIPSLTGNDLALNSNTADALRSVAADIRHATESVNMVFYIWHPGGHADDVAKAVCDAARRGVTVRIMLDSAGSKEFFRSHWPAAMRNAGVHLVESLAVTPFRMFFRRQDIRQHRKIVVIDNAIGYTGSMNMVDPRFFKQDSGVGQWVDVMVRITGPVVPLLNSILCWDWEVETGNRNLPPHNCVVPEGHKHLTHAVQVVPSGPSMPDGLIQQVLHLAIHQAQRSVTITTPYLVPGDYLLETLKTTAYRGIDVSIIIPAKNDSLMVEWASRAFFSDLLEAGVKIYRFGGGLLHTKSVMIDDDYCLIGTVNMDMRSFWLNFELTLAVDDPEFCSDLIGLQKSYLDQSTLVDIDKWKSRPIYNKPVEQFFYMFSPLL